MTWKDLKNRVRNEVRDKGFLIFAETKKGAPTEYHVSYAEPSHTFRVIMRGKNIRAFKSKHVPDDVLRDCIMFTK